MSTNLSNVVEGTWSSPPSNLEAEQQVLGALMVSNRLFSEIGTFLEARHFADRLHARIYEAIAWMIGRGREVSPVTMRTFFENDDALKAKDGGHYIERLAAATVSVVNAPDAARTLVDLWQRREIIPLLQDALADAYSPNFDRSGAEVIGDAISSLQSLGRNGPFKFKTARDVRIEITESLKVDVPKTSSGYARLDHAMGGGFFAGKMYGLIARKKVGKTMICGGLSHHMNRSGARVLYIALEMGSGQIEQRAMARDMKINALKFLVYRPDSDDGFIAAAGQQAIEGGDSLLYADMPGASFDRIRRALETFVMQYPDAAGFFIDYMQMIRGRPRDQNQAEFLDDVANWFAMFCQERKVWGIVVAQENQTGNVRGGEGLRLACDMCFELCRTADAGGNEGEGTDAWLNMIETRYTPWRNVGSATDPSLHLESRTGPFYEEIPIIAPDQTEEVLI